MPYTCMVQANHLGAASPRTDEAADEAAELVRALMALAGRMRRIGDTGSVDRAAMIVLHHLSCAPGPTRISELASGLRLDSSTVSRHVAALERSGHLERTSDPDDHRAARIALTDPGRQALATAMRTWRDTLEAALVGWPARDRATLTALLARLAADLDTATSLEKDS